MRALSAVSQISDPYRAGLELGEALAPLQPEVVFLFATIHYQPPADLLEGLYDGLEHNATLVIGTSGDGFFSTGLAADFGCSALGLHSDGQVNWQLSHASGATVDPVGAVRSAFASQQGGVNASLFCLFADFHADTSKIEQVLRDEITVPVVGGIAADDNQMSQCWLYHNRQACTDSVVLLGAYGPLRFDISIGNSLGRVGNPGLVQAAEGKTLQRIDNLSATEFIERETGKPVLQTDRGIVALSIIDPEQPQQMRLRTIVPDFSQAEGSLGLYGGIEAGKTVQVCLAQPQDLIAEVYTLAERAQQLGFAPKAALVISCAGRKWLLGGQISHEVTALAERFPQGLALAGFPSFGEIAPHRQGAGYAANQFHNMTYILLLLGDST